MSLRDQGAHDRGAPAPIFSVFSDKTPGSDNWVVAQVVHGFYNTFDRILPDCFAWSIIVAPFEHEKIIH